MCCVKITYAFLIVHFLFACTGLLDIEMSFHLRANIFLVAFFLGGSIGCAHQGETAHNGKLNSDLLAHHASSKNSVGQYLVRDSSLTQKPTWFEDPKAWALDHEDNPFDFEYFVSESGPKLQRNLACEFSRNNIRENWAKKISAQLTKGLREHWAKQTKTNDEATKMKFHDFLETQFPLKIQSFIKGAQVLRTYWEYREYKVELGAESNFRAYTCQSLVRILRSQIQKATELSRDYLLSQKLTDQHDPDFRKIIETNANQSINELNPIENQLPSN